jgi:hypothetical protein
MRKHPNSQREATATAPVLDSTPLYAQNPLNERNRPFSRVDKGIDTYY